MTPGAVRKEPEAGARERLLTAALALFNEKGYAATSVRELVQAAGVMTKPVLYYYFGNKEGIYLELMDNSHSTFESLAAKIGSLEGSAQERIVRFCSDLFDVSTQNLPLVRLIYAIYYGPPQGAPQFDLDAFLPADGAAGAGAGPGGGGAGRVAGKQRRGRGAGHRCHTELLHQRAALPKRTEAGP